MSNPDVVKVIFYYGTQEQLKWEEIYKWGTGLQDWYVIYGNSYAYDGSNKLIQKVRACLGFLKP